MSHYVSVAQLKAFKDKSGQLYDLSAFNEEELQDALDEVEALVENICGTKFYTLQEVWLMDGNGEFDLRFPESGIPYPLLSCTKVEEVDEDESVQEEFTENDEFVNCGLFLRTGPTGSGIRLRRIATTCGYWPRGIRNIRVEGLWGYTSAPKDLVRAVKQWTIETLTPGATGLERGDIVQQSWPDYSVTYRSRGTQEAYSNSGILAIDRVLKRHVCMSTLFIRGSRMAYLKSSVAQPTQATGEGISVLQNDPNYPTLGQFWYNSTERVWKGWDGVNKTVWGVPNLANAPIPSELEARAIKEYAGDPATPVEGDVWFNTVEGKMKGFNGVATYELGPGNPMMIGTYITKKYIGVYAGDPTPIEPCMWYNSVEKKWKYFDGVNVTTIGGP